MPKTLRRPPLTRDRIVQAALDVIDAEGLDALSMRRVGSELGVEAMSLYNHVPNKSALLDGVYERVLSEVADGTSAQGWEAFVRHQARSMRRALSAHPNAIPLFAFRPATTDASLRRLEQSLGVLRAAGFAPLDALELVQIVLSFVVGHTMWSVAPPAASEPAEPRYASLDEQEFPRVREAARQLSRYRPDAEFEHGLDALIVGLAARRAAARGR